MFGPHCSTDQYGAPHCALPVQNPLVDKLFSVLAMFFFALAPFLGWFVWLLIVWVLLNLAYRKVKMRHICLGALLLTLPFLVRVQVFPDTFLLGTVPDVLPLAFTRQEPMEVRQMISLLPGIPYMGMVV